MAQPYSFRLRSAANAAAKLSHPEAVQTYRIYSEAAALMEQYESEIAHERACIRSAVAMASPHCDWLAAFRTMKDQIERALCRPEAAGS